jgi:hypothetical protein
LSISSASGGKMEAMLPFHPEEFGLSVRIDNGLAAYRVSNGETIGLSEIVQLMAAGRCLFDLATLAAREMTRVRDCLMLWSSMVAQFTEMCQAWESVPPNGELIGAYRAELIRLRGLCEDRREMFVVTSKERLRHAASRDSEIESFGQRNHTSKATIAPGPSGWRDQSSPAHVYRLGHF